MIPSIEDILNGTVAEFDDEPVAVGPHNAVLTEVLVKTGAKSGIPYLNVRATIFDGPNAKRNVFGISSFSEKALTMPGGVTQLLQCAGIGADLPKDTPAAQIPAVLAEALTSTPVIINVSHEHDGRPGDKKYNTDGTPKMRATIDFYEPADEDFLATFGNAVEGIDDDVPF